MLGKLPNSIALSNSILEKTIIGGLFLKNLFIMKKFMKFYQYLNKN
jgi:hypothetical protein